MAPRRPVATGVGALLIALGACADAELVGPPGGPAEHPAEVAAARAAGGNGKGKPGGGPGGGDDAPVVDELAPWDPAVWVPQDHLLGRGRLDPANVAQGALGLLLGLPAGSYDGAEVRSAERQRYRQVEARLRTAHAPGSISAFFFYEGDRRRNDEIDIEIFNDGSRAIWFTTWQADRQTNHSEHVLPFDPSAGFHDYRIEWSSSRVAFYVDGVLFEEFTSGIPRDAMFLYANAWWPTWLAGPTPATSAAVEIDRITY